MEDEELARIEEMKIKINKALVIVSMVLLFTLNLLMLIIGYVEKGKCPAQENIPLYLFVAGTVGILSKLLPFIDRKFNLIAIRYLIVFLYIFESIWTIVGSVWVYGTTPNYDKSSGGSKYCSKQAYLLSFWLLTTHWILVAMFCATGCVYCWVLRRSALFRCESDMVRENVQR